MTVVSTPGGRRVVPVTVAIAARDRPDALLRCVSAVLNGRCLPAELIVVDQSRTTDGRSIVERAALGAPIVIRHIQQGGDGLSRSRNLAVASAQQEIVAVTDDDCVPDDQWVEAIYSVLMTPSGPDAVTGRVLPLEADAPGLFATSTRAGSVRQDFASRVIPWLVGTGANFATWKKTLGDLNGYDERLGAGTRGAAGEDLELIDRFLTSGRRIRYEPTAIVYHARKSRSERTATRWSYGMGVGALCGLRLRAGDWFGLHVVARWALMRLAGLGRALMRIDAVGCREELLMLRGTMAGVAYGWHLAPASQTERR